MPSKTLNLKDPDAYRLAQQIASKTGLSMTQAAVAAMREKLERLRSHQTQIDLEEEMRAIARRIAKLPVLDSRSADEILGFNEHGLLD